MKRVSMYRGLDQGTPHFLGAADISLSSWHDREDKASQTWHWGLCGEYRSAGSDATTEQPLQ